MTIEQLREYIKKQRDEAYKSLRSATSMMSWRESALHSSPSEGVIGLANKLLNLIDYGQEERPSDVEKRLKEKYLDYLPRSFKTFNTLRERYEKGTGGLFSHEED